MRRVRALLQMLGALAVLGGLLGGIPWALLRFGDWPITGVPTWEQVVDLPTTVVTDEALFAVLTLALWASWALFAGSVVAEVGAQVQGRTSELNFGGPVQRLAGRLVGSVVVSFGSFTSMAATAVPVMAAPAPATPVELHVGDVAAPSAVWSSAATGAGVHIDLDAQGQPVPSSSTSTPSQATRTINVERGDTSWSLAVEHLGDGLRWREIWELNQHRVQPDGETWANASASVRPGWELVIPVTGTGAGFEEPAQETTTTSTPTSAPSTSTPSSTSVPAPPQQTPPPAQTPPPPTAPPVADGELVVMKGDNFWDLAEAELAEQWGRAPTDAEVVPYWQQLIEANRDRLLPPEDPDLIYPAQMFTVPATPADPLAPPLPPAPPGAGSGSDAPEPPADGSGTETPPTTENQTPPSTEQQTDGTTPTTEQQGESPPPTEPSDEETPPSTEESEEETPPSTEDQAPPSTDSSGGMGGIPGSGDAPPVTGDGPEPGGGDTPPSTDGSVDSPPSTDEAPVDEVPADTPPPADAGEVPPTDSGTGEPTRPTATPTPETISHQEESSGVHKGLLYGGVALAGVLLMVERRRRAQLRRRARGHIAAMPPPDMQHDERELRYGADVDGARLLDVALRAAAAASGAAGLPPVRWVEASGNAVILVLDSPSPPPRGFMSLDLSSWMTAASFEELAAIAARRDMPTPTLIPLGSSADGTEVLVELEASPVVSVSGPMDQTLGLLRAMAVAASTAPWSEQSRVLLVGMEGELTEMPWVTSVPRLADALDEAEAHSTRINTALRTLRCQTTAQARAAGVGVEASEPLVVVSAVRPNDLGERQRLTALTNRPHGGVAVITPANGTPIGRLMSIGDDGWLRIAGIDKEVQPHRLDTDDTSVVVALLDVAARHEDVPIEEVFQQMDVRRPPSAMVTVPDVPPPSSAPLPGFLPDDHAPFAPPLAPPVAPPPPPVAPPVAPPPPPPVEPEVEVEPQVDADILAPFLHEVPDDVFEDVDEVDIAPAPPPPPPPAPPPLPPPPTPVPPPPPPLEVPEPVVAAVPAPIEEPEEAPVRDLAALMDDVDVLVRVFGEVQAVRPPRHEHDVEAPLLPTRQKGLEAIVYLALRESSVDREDLEINLFPDGANASKTVYNTISSARALVGEDLFPRTEGGRYELSERVLTDYGLFCDLVAQAEATDDVEEAANLLGEALGLVRGEPFVGVGRSYAWVGPHRGMIVAQVVDAAEELAEIRLATGDWRLAEWAARRGLRAFPSDERMYRLLMRAARAAGNVPGVQRVFRELCDVIADPDMGVEPEDTLHPETVALLEELTRRSSPSREHRSA